MVRDIDFDENGEIDFPEFVVLMVKTLNEAGQAPEELAELFDRFDINKDGKIDSNDLMNKFR